MMTVSAVAVSSNARLLEHETNAFMATTEGSSPLSVCGSADGCSVAVSVCGSAEACSIASTKGTCGRILVQWYQHLLFLEK
jgi:hypothetical protein